MSKYTVREALEVFEDVILSVENRCMAVDGPVTPTLQEMREDELRRLWKATRKIRKELAALEDDGWVKCSERLPKAEDAVEGGVWVVDQQGGGKVIRVYWGRAYAFKYWMKIKFPSPPPTEEGTKE